MKKRVVRCDDKLWADAMAKAKRHDVSLSRIIRDGLRQYVQAPEH